MRGACVHFDFRRQARLGECILQNIFIFGRLRIIISRNRNKKLGLAFRRL